MLSFSFRLCLVAVGIFLLFVDSTFSSHSSAFVKPWGWFKGNKMTATPGEKSPAGQSQSQSRPSTSASTKSNTASASSAGDKVRKVLKSGLPPTMLFLLGTAESASASPLNPQAVVLQSPFFQGWLVRVTDHEVQGSFVLIIGSFSASESKEYSEHYIFCGVDSKKADGTEFQVHAEVFPDPQSVSITGAPASSPLSRALPPVFAHRPPTNITWHAGGVGKFSLREHECSADLQLGAIRLQFSTESNRRLPWSSSNPQSAGPEGWLGYTSLLPCHYFVHSVGSPCHYSISTTGAHDSSGGGDGSDESTDSNDSNDDGRNSEEGGEEQHWAGVGRGLLEDANIVGAMAGLSPSSSSSSSSGPFTPTLRLLSSLGESGSRSDDDNSGGNADGDSGVPSNHLAPDGFSSVSPPFSSSPSSSSSPPALAPEWSNPFSIRGRGLAHIEGNHGTFFPEGWVWSQAVSEDNTASLGLVSGKFQVGPVAPMNSVVYFRSANRTRIFRSTDMDSIKVRTVDHSRGEVLVTAVSRLDGCKAEISIRGGPPSWKREAPLLHIPTRDGFSNNPGCRETYAAVARVRCYRRVNKRNDLVSYLHPEYELEEEVTFPLTALEFGAGFLSQIVRTRASRFPWREREE